jgi:hypothetical protein
MLAIKLKESHAHDAAERVHFEDCSKDRFVVNGMAAIDFCERWHRFVSTNDRE